MASYDRQQALALTERLLARGDRYSFFQAHRLLRLLGHHDGQSSEDTLRVRPRLGLGFPQTDLQGIEPRPSGGYRVTANFLGLYGVDSPLPTFYTEDLLDEQADGHSVNREFLDILAQSIYPLFFRAWLKSRPALRVVEYGDERMLGILYAFVGLASGGPSLQRAGVGSLLHCGALFSHQVRTAAGLQAIVQACLPEAEVKLEQLQSVAVPIAPDQRLRLGQQACRLGQDAHLGSECRSLSGLLLRIHGLSAEDYRALLPGGQGHERLRFLVDYYLVEALPVQIELGLRPGEAASPRLGHARWGRLGADTWLMPAQQGPVTCAGFALHTHRSGAPHGVPGVL